MIRDEQTFLTTDLTADDQPVNRGYAKRTLVSLLMNNTEATL